MNTSLHSCAALVMLLLLGCEHAFDPKGRFEESLAVYGVLRSTGDTQFVRVHATYNPPEFDPLMHTNEPDLTAATVTLRSDSGTVMLSDSLVAHPDQRYGSSMRIFYVAPFTPHRGMRYTVSVSVPGYPTASSTTVLPRSPVEFRLTNTAILSTPRLYQSQDINLVFKAPPETYGFLVRMFLEYEVLTAPSSVERTEIPIRLVETESVVTPEYAELTPLVPSTDNPFNILTFWSLQTDAYSYLVSELVNEHGFANLRFRKVIVNLYQVDESVYAYYNIVNGFRDEFSIRTDLPDYSNITGGVGVFGAVSLDSLSIPVTSNIQF